jgi:hypothetical protein
MQMHSSSLKGVRHAFNPPKVAGASRRLIDDFSSAPDSPSGSNRHPSNLRTTTMKIQGFLLALPLILGPAVLAGQNPSGQPSGSTSPSSNSMTPAANDGTLMPGSSDNAALQGRINDALRNEPALAASHVNASVTDRAIEVSGTVGSTKDKQTAERIASSFDGNHKVTNNIVVTGAGHSDLAPNHPAMNNGGTGNAQNPATNTNSTYPRK